MTAASAGSVPEPTSSGTRPSTPFDKRLEASLGDAEKAGWFTLAEGCTVGGLAQFVTGLMERTAQPMCPDDPERSCRGGSCEFHGLLRCKIWPRGYSFQRLSENGPSAPSSSPAGPSASGSSTPVPCPTCGLNTWDGLHRNGHRDCYMDEVPQ